MEDFVFLGEYNIIICLSYLKTTLEQAFLIGRKGGLWRNSDFCIDGQKANPFLFPCYPLSLNSQQRWGLHIYKGLNVCVIICNTLYVYVVLYKYIYIYISGGKVIICLFDF